MMASGTMEKCMERENSNGLMGLPMKDNLYMGKSKEKGNSHSPMVTTMMATGSEANKKELVPYAARIKTSWKRESGKLVPSLTLSQMTNGKNRVALVPAEGIKYSTMSKSRSKMKVRSRRLGPKKRVL